MATVAEVLALAASNQERLVDVQSALDVEQEQIAQALDKLQDIIDGSDAAQQAALQPIADILTESAAKLEAFTTDVAGTIPDLPPAPPTP